MQQYRIDNLVAQAKGVLAEEMGRIYEREHDSWPSIWTHLAQRVTEVLSLSDLLSALNSIHHLAQGRYDESEHEHLRELVEGTEAERVPVEGKPRSKDEARLHVIGQLSAEALSLLFPFSLEAKTGAPDD
jgi:hypothetical protein